MLTQVLYVFINNVFMSLLTMSYLTTPAGQTKHVFLGQARKVFCLLGEHMDPHSWSLWVATKYFPPS